MSSSPCSWLLQHRHRSSKQAATPLELPVIPTAHVVSNNVKLSRDKLTKCIVKVYSECVYTLEVPKIDSFLKSYSAKKWLKPVILNPMFEDICIYPPFSLVKTPGPTPNV